MVGAAILALGVAALFTGLFAHVANQIAIVGAGALLVFFGVSVLGRTVSLPFSRASALRFRGCGASPGNWRGRTPCETRSAPPPAPRRS